mmetsp:Transcript_4921/g.12087  ORF Transcript_4921/g.12087 Transcript_4921/m.12087 type:complete len:124 (+) Transcript_4921:648-1019(+)
MGLPIAVVVMEVRVAVEIVPAMAMVVTAWAGVAREVDMLAVETALVMAVDVVTMELEAVNALVHETSTVDGTVTRENDAQEQSGSAGVTVRALGFATAREWKSLMVLQEGQQAPSAVRNAAWE